MSCLTHLFLEYRINQLLVVEELLYCKGDTNNPLRTKTKFKNINNFDQFVFPFHAGIICIEYLLEIEHMSYFVLFIDLKSIKCIVVSSLHLKAFVFFLAYYNVNQRICWHKRCSLIENTMVYLSHHTFGTCLPVRRPNQEIQKLSPVDQGKC